MKRWDREREGESDRKRNVEFTSGRDGMFVLG